MLDKMKQMMDMKRKADEIKRELESSEMEINNTGAIRIVINGAQNIKSIKIDHNFYQEQPGKLEKDLVLCTNAAVKKSQELAAQKMKQAVGMPF